MLYLEVLESYDVEITDVKRINALLMDYVPKLQRERKLIVSALKEGVGLRGYAQSNPLQVYALEGFQMFDNMLAAISEEISSFLLNAEVRQNTEREEIKNIRTNDGKETLKKTPKKKTQEKIGRNDPCPCGSGKKYKQCCGK